jgi:ABC-type multidrug transport system fused ATPase/permease subunit
MASFVASVLTVAFFFPAFLVPAFAIGFVYYRLAIGYLNTGRDLRRMESNARSPIFSGFGELLEGIVTVRAFAVEKKFLDGLHVKIDVATKVRPNFSSQISCFRADTQADVVQLLDDEPLAAA